VKKRLLLASLVAFLLGASFASPPAQVSGNSGNTTPVLAATPTTSPASSQQTQLNPLTGLPVEDASLLELPPALISVSNFPVSARPQSGLSTSPIVFEMYIGEGMTRFLAMFYGDYAKGQKTAAQQAAEDAKIGPIRSGRLAYEDVRTLYNGFLVMGGAYSKVAQQLNQTTNIYGSDPNDINSAGITLANLQALAESQKTGHQALEALQGMQFSEAIPAAGEAASRLWMFYNYYNQVEWNYDAPSGAYLRSQDRSDGTGKFYPASDQLTGEPLAFNNVVVLFANHNFIAPTLIDIELLYVKDYPALLFRDGKVYQAKWSTRAPIKPIQLTDLEGNPLPYKPGNTWFEIVDHFTPVKQIEPGVWKARFYAPK